MRLDADTLAAGYEMLFEPVARAAHRACLEHARLTRDDGWPTVETCLAFAGPYGILGADLAAFFGYIGIKHGRRTIWVDALRGPISSHSARQQATRWQVLALGFTQMVAELPS